MNTKDLIERISSTDRDVRANAWQNAATAGPDALEPLARITATGDTELRRAATRAMWKIVRHVGRPGACSEKITTSDRLAALLGEEHPASVRREVLWMISELAENDPVVERVAALLDNKALREDARCTLERIPGRTALRALTSALENAPGDFQPALAQSLRARGVHVDGIPCRKLVPTRETKIEAAGT